MNKEDIVKFLRWLGDCHGMDDQEEAERVADNYINKNETKTLNTDDVILPDTDNYDYLRGFIDGYGGEEPNDVFPDGFKDINEVWDKMYELKGNESNITTTNTYVDTV